MDRLPESVESPRLILRHWTKDDVPSLAAAIEANLDHLRPWMPWVAYEPMTVDDRVALIAKWHAEWECGGDSVLGIFCGGDVIGGAGLHKRVGPGAVEIGYWVHVDHVRQGYAAETAAALTQAAFDMSSIDRVEIHHDKANVASATIPRRLGFRLVEEVPDQAEAPGEVGIECRWAITRKTWEERNDA